MGPLRDATQLSDCKSTLLVDPFIHILYFITTANCILQYTQMLVQHLFAEIQFIKQLQPVFASE